MGRRAAKRHKRLRIGLILLAAAFILLLIFSYAFFSDNIKTIFWGTAGTVKLQPVQLLIEQNPNGITNWKPGDVAAIEWTVQNAGNKSVYTRNTLEIAWDINPDKREQNIIYLYPAEISDDAIRDDILNNNAAGAIDIGSDDHEIITGTYITNGYIYQFLGDVLDGVGLRAETGDATVTGSASQTIRFKLAFSPNATPEYENTEVYVHAIAEAAQYRNSAPMKVEIAYGREEI